MDTDKAYDILVIGAGPAGLACAIEARKAGLECIVVDKAGIAGNIQQFQRDMHFFSTPELLEIGGVPFLVSTTRPTSLDCVNYYRMVADHFRLTCRFHDRVTSVVSRARGFSVRTARGDITEAESVVVAVGYYDTPTPLGVPGEALPEVTHYYRDPLPYFRQNVLIVGGKNSAVEAALDLYRHGANVTVVHRGTTLSNGVKYWILPDFENRVAQGMIRLHLGTIVEEFLPGSVRLRSAEGHRWEHRTDFSFILIGYRPDVPFLRSMGIVVDPDTLAPLHNPETMETNVPGLYVAGGLVGGRFNNRVFIENGREHGKRIVDAITARRSVTR